MADVPDQIGYGEVTGRFVSFRADGTDVGEVPDEVPLSGTVTLTPSVNLVRFPTLEPPRIAAISSVTAQVVNGDLKAPDGTGGLFVIATDQPLGQPDKVQWKATFNLAGAVVQPGAVTFDVPAGGVVDLTTVIPATPAPGTVTVVSIEDRVLAQQARDEAELARDAAQSAAQGAVAAAQAELQGFVDSAELARDAAQDIVDNADLSDTGWVDFTPSTGWTLPTTGIAPQYRVKNGIAYFRGAVSSPSGGTGTKPPLILPEATAPAGGPKPRRTYLALATSPAIVQGLNLGGVLLLHSGDFCQESLHRGHGTVNCPGEELVGHPGCSFSGLLGKFL